MDVAGSIPARPTKREIVVCNILDKWKCEYCPLKDTEKMKVIQCDQYDPVKKDCAMPIRVEVTGE